jgi:hypothetical protein
LPPLAIASGRKDVEPAHGHTAHSISIQELNTRSYYKISLQDLITRAHCKILLQELNTRERLCAIYACWNPRVVCRYCYRAPMGKENTAKVVCVCESYPVGWAGRAHPGPEWSPPRAPTIHKKPTRYRSEMNSSLPSLSELYRWLALDCGICGENPESQHHLLHQKTWAMSASPWRRRGSPGTRTGAEASPACAHTERCSASEAQSPK